MAWRDSGALRRSADGRRLVTNQPPGGLLHASGFDDAGLRVVDLWESAEAFQAFVATTLTASVTKLGITTQPNVSMFDAAYVGILDAMRSRM